MSSTGQAVGGIVGAVVGFVYGGPGGAIYGAQLGMAAGGLLDPPKLPSISGPRLSDLSVQTSSYGVPLARLYGTVPIVGNIFWLENNRIKEVVKKQKQGGKGGPSQEVKTYSYYATFAVALADTSKTGPILGVRRIWIGPVLWYNNGSFNLETLTSSAAKRAAAGMKGGSATSGPRFALYDGSPTQQPDARMQADIGVDDCPAYRNTAYIVFYDLPLEKWSNSLQAAQVKVEVVTASGSTPYLLDEIDLSDSPIDDYHQILISKPLAQYIDAARATFYLTATELAVVTTQRATTTGGKEISSVATLLTGGALTALYIKQDTQQAAASGSVSGYYWHEIGEFFYPAYVDRAVQKEGITLQFSNSLISIPGQYTAPSAIAPAALYTVSAGASESFVDVDIFGGEIYALVYNTASGDYSVEVYDETLALARTVTSTYLNSVVTSAAATDAAVFVTEQEICVYSGESEREFVFIDHSGAELSTVTLPPGSLGAAGNTGVRHGMTLFGRLVWMWNSGDQIMRVFNLESPDLSLVPLADIVSAELQLSGAIDTADIDVADLTAGVRGYRIPGGTIRSALAPLQGAFPFDLTPSGYQIKAVPRGQSAVATIDAGELGAVAGTGIADVVLDGPGREMDTQLPKELTVKYLDAARDYDVNQQSYGRIATDAVGSEVQDVALVMTGDEAAGMAQTLLFLRWLERDDYTATLPPTYNNLEPADVVNIVTDYATIPLRITEISDRADGVRECRFKPNAAAIYTPNATGGQGVLPDGEIPLPGDSLLVLLDVPLLRTDLDSPGFIATMSGETVSWPGGTAYRSNDNGATFTDVQSFPLPGTLGIARGTLGADDGLVIDRTSTLTVDWRAGTPESVTEDQILSGYNYYAYGADGRWEIVAIADIDLQVDGSYLCSTLLRGMYGTAWATGLHAAGDYLVLLDDADNAFIGSDYGSFGVERIWRGVTFGETTDTASDQLFSYDGVNLKPLSPVNAAATRDGSNNISATFNRRSRYTDSFWSTGVQPVLGEATEAYEIDVLSGAVVVRTITATTGAFSYSAADQTADGLTPGDPVPFEIYQISATVGRGYPLEVTL